MQEQDKDSLYRISRHYLKRKAELDKARRAIAEAEENYNAIHAVLLMACERFNVQEFSSNNTLFTVGAGSVVTQKIVNAPSLVLGVMRILRAI